MNSIPDKELTIYINIMKKTINNDLKYLHDFKKNIVAFKLYVDSSWFVWITGENAYETIKNKICSQNYIRIIK